MAKQYVFFLIGWLFLAHVTTTLAATARQKLARDRTFLQSESEVIALLGRFPAGNATSGPATRRATAATVQNDTIKKRLYVVEEEVMIQRIWMYSAILPGWGQVCNKHYWKVPVIYGGFAGLIGGTFYYQGAYLKYKSELIQSKKVGASLERCVNECRRERDLFFIFAALWYIVNIFDAYVGASLRTFTLSDNISMEVGPTLLPVTPHSLPTMGLSLTLSFQN